MMLSKSGRSLHLKAFRLHAHPEVAPQRSQSPAANSLERSTDNLLAGGVRWGCYAVVNRIAKRTNH